MLRLFRDYLKKYRFLVFLGSFLKVLEVIWELLVPFIVRYMIDNVVNNATLSSDERIRELWICGGILIALAVAGLITTMIAQYIAAKVAQSFGNDLRKDLFRHINTLSFKELDQISTASLITRIQSDTLNVLNGVGMLIRLLLRAPIIIVGSTIMCFIVNWRIGFVVLGFTLLLLILIYSVLFFLVPLSKKSQMQLDNVTKVSKENLSGNRVVRAFNKQKYEFLRFVDNQEKLTNIQTKIATVDALLNPLTLFLANFASVIVMYVGGSLFLVGGISQGDIQAFLSYFIQIQLAVVASTILVVLFSKAVTSSARIVEVLDLKSSLSFGELTNINQTDDTVVDFNDVTFKYNENANPALEHVSFKIRKGETIGIIGGTGSGKSTIVNLINRFYDTTSGTVSLFGHNVREYAVGVINDNVATVMQRTALFNGTVKDNLLKAKKDANDEEIKRALKVAQAYDFVSNFDDGINHAIYQGAKNISGGQKQRLSIARAVIKDAPILILDDSSSALDYQTEASLRYELQTLKQTTIIISQRAISLMHADKILVLEKGHLTDIGSHAYLYKHSKLYHEICTSQDVGERANV